MFDVMVSKKEVTAVRDYVENKGLVAHMNNAGLSMSSMALVLNAILYECDRIEEELGKSSSTPE